MTARIGTSSPPKRSRSGPVTETEHWKVEKDPAHPHDRKKDQWKPTKGGYQTRPSEPVPPGMEAVHIWMQDMREWGIMMHEAIVELRQRIEELEKKC
jgi:hypothetical protein